MGLWESLEIEWMDYSLQSQSIASCYQQVRCMRSRKRTNLPYKQNSKYDAQKNKNELMEITLRNQIIPYNESTQFPGMTLNSKLYQKQHIDRVKAKAKRALNNIQVVVGKKRGGDCRTLKRLYSVICRSKIEQLPTIQHSHPRETKKLSSIHR